MYSNVSFISRFIVHFLSLIRLANRRSLVVDLEVSKLVVFRSCQSIWLNSILDALLLVNLWHSGDFRASYEDLFIHDLTLTYYLSLVLDIRTLLASNVLPVVVEHTLELLLSLGYRRLLYLLVALLYILI